MFRQPNTVTAQDLTKNVSYKSSRWKKCKKKIDIIAGYQAAELNLEIQFNLWF